MRKVGIGFAAVVGLTAMLNLAPPASAAYTCVDALREIDKMDRQFFDNSVKQNFREAQEQLRHGNERECRTYANRVFEEVRRKERAFGSDRTEARRHDEWYEDRRYRDRRYAERRYDERRLNDRWYDPREGTWRHDNRQWVHPQSLGGADEHNFRRDTMRGGAGDK